MICKIPPPGSSAKPNPIFSYTLVQKKSEKKFKD